MVFLSFFFLFSLTSIAYSQCIPSLSFFNPRTGVDFLTVNLNDVIPINSLVTQFEIRADFCGEDIQSIGFRLGENNSIAENEVSDRVDNTEPYTSDIITGGAISRIRERLNTGDNQFLIVLAFDELKGSGNLVDSLTNEFVLTTKTRIIPPPSSTVAPSPSEPSLTPSEPPLTPSEPPLTPSEPPLTPSEPPLTPSEPPLTPSEPPLTSSEPPLTSSEPPLTTSEPPLAPGSIFLVSHSTTTFNAPRPFVFEVSGTIFQQSSELFAVTLNDNDISTSSIDLTPTRLTVDSPEIRASTLTDARVDIFISAPVSDGGPVTFSTEVWVGNESSTVNLVDSSGNPFLIPTSITATLAAAISVRAVVNTSTGSATFNNVPDSFILIEVISENNDIAIAGGDGDGSISIEITGFGDPSSVDNNDFSRGLAGWDVPNRSITGIVPHVEDVGPGEDPGPEPSEIPFENPGIEDEFENADLQLGTEGADIQQVSRTFETSFGTTGVRMRYRFVTAEVTTGFNINAEFNDFFEVSIRSRIAGDGMVESASISELGLEAFNEISGSTAWMELILPLDEDFDTVEVRVSVANAGDENGESQVIVDFVEELGCNLGEAEDTPVGAMILELANEANALAQGIGLPGARNGRLDAFRQCVWSCRLRQQFGSSQATRIGDLHEACGSNPEEERLMDLHNNEIGRGFGAPAANCGDACLEGVSNGALQISL